MDRDTVGAGKESEDGRRDRVGFIGSPCLPHVWKTAFTAHPAFEHLRESPEKDLVVFHVRSVFFEMARYRRLS